MAYFKVSYVREYGNHLIERMHASPYFQRVHGSTTRSRNWRNPVIGVRAGYRQVMPPNHSSFYTLTHRVRG
jgi:hypothetical protein